MEVTGPIGTHASWALPGRGSNPWIATHPAIVYHVMRAISATVHATQRRLSHQAVELSNYIYKQHGRY